MEKSNKLSKEITMNQHIKKWKVKSGNEKKKTEEIIGKFKNISWKHEQFVKKLADEIFQLKNQTKFEINRISWKNWGFTRKH